MYYINALIAYMPYFVDVAIYWGKGAVVLSVLLMLFLLGAYVCKKISIKKIVFIEILVIYSFYVMVFTVLSRMPIERYQYMLTPFWSYAKAIVGSAIYKKQILFNILMFVPLGLLLPPLFQKNKFKATISVSLLFTVGIEVLQLVLKRGMFEFDDIFSNVLGALVGACIYFIIRKIITRKRRWYNLYDIL